MGSLEGRISGIDEDVLLGTDHVPSDHDSGIRLVEELTDLVAKAEMGQQWETAEPKAREAVRNRAFDQVNRDIEVVVVSIGLGAPAILNLLKNVRLALRGELEPSPNVG